MRWEPSEDKFLLEHYTNLGPARCAFMLTRSERSVHGRVRRLGIKMDNPYLRENSLGFDRSKPTILYLISIPFENGRLYKLGITNTSVQSRYKEEFNKLNMRIEWTKEFETGLEAYNEEQELLRKYSEHRVNTGVLKSGNTETLDIYISKELK